MIAAGILLVAVALAAGACGKKETAPPPTPTAAPTAAAAPTAPPTPGAAEVSVTVQGAFNLGSLQLELGYDPQAYELQDVKAGTLARNALVDSNEVTPGHVSIGVVSASGISGDGAIINLSFKGTGRGGSPGLTVEKVEAADTDLRDLVVSASPGELAAAGGQVKGPVLTFRQ